MNKVNHKDNTFAINTYQKFKRVNITSYLVDQGISIMSSIVIAQCVSSEALAAVSIISPLYSIVLFLTVVIAEATSNKVQLELGAFNKEKAANMLSTGIVVSLITGILILACFLFGKDLYFDFMNISDATRNYAREYLLFYQISFALFPYNVTLDSFIAYSANVKVMFAKRGVTLVCNSVLAFIFTMLWGISGIGLASLVSNVIGICLMNTHFSSEYAAVKPKWMKMEVEYISALKGALAGGTSQLTVALSGIIINKIIINKFGSNADQLLSILSIVGSVMIFECLYEALAQTARSQLDIYSVEGNYKTANVLIKAALKDSLKAGVLLTILYQLLAPLVPLIYNITDPAMAETCIVAVRWGAALTMVRSIYSNYKTMHQGLQHFLTVTLSIITGQLLVYCSLMFALTEFFAEDGIWIAYGTYTTIAILIILLATWLYTRKHKDRSFPWLFDINRPQPIVYNSEMTEEKVLEVRDNVIAQLEDAGVDARTKYRVSLVIEEFGMLVVEKNKAAKEGETQQTILSEWDVWVDEENVTTIVRDNGKPLDFSDEDNSTGSLGAYFLSCLMPNVGQVNYATAISMNRHRFQVARSSQE